MPSCDLQGMGQAAATQCVNVAVAMALANAELRRTGVPVRNPIASNSTDPSLFAMTGWDRGEGDEERNELVAVVSTAQLVYNANPVKLGAEGIRSAAKKLAKMECVRNCSNSRTRNHSRVVCVDCAGLNGKRSVRGWRLPTTCLRLSVAPLPAVGR